jgi:hypothetical protein
MNNYNKINISDDDNWTFGCNKCFICDGIYRHSTVITKYEDGLEEVKMRFIHPHCARSAQRLQKLKDKLLDAEFNHFCLKFDKYFIN